MEPNLNAPQRHVERVARRRHGVVTRDEAVRAGMTTAQVDRRVRHGQWVVGPAKGTLLLSEYANSHRSKLAAADIGLGTVAWGASAIALFGLADDPLIPVVALGRHAQSRKLRIVVVRELELLTQTRRFDLRTVTLEMALATMARTLNRRALDELLDEALRQQLTTWSRIERGFELFARPGRPGSKMLRSILADRRLEARVPLSIWSRDFAARLVKSGFPRPEMEWRVVDGAGRFVAQVDLAYPEHRYAIELDSKEFHLNSKAFETDRYRDGLLRIAGWRVGRFTWDQFRQDWTWVTAVLGAELGG